MSKSDHLHEPVLASHPAIAKQIKLEKQAVAEGAARYRKQVADATRRGEGSRVHAVEHTRVGWFQDLRSAIVRERVGCRRHPDRYKRHAYARQILELKSSVLAALTIDAGLSRILKEGDDVSWVSFCHAIGSAVLAELNNGKIRQAKSLQKMRAASRRTTVRHVNRWARLNLDDPDDSKMLACAVGDFLGAALITCASVASNDGTPFPAFRKYRGRAKDGGTRRPWRVRLSDEAVATISAWHSAIQRQRPAHLPMLVEPMPWQVKTTPMGRHTEGGRITASYPLVSKATKGQKEAYLRADLTETFAGIAAISATPGRVDEPVACVIEHYAESGGRLSIPPSDDPPRPPKPADGTPEELDEWRKSRSAWYRASIKRASQREGFAHSLTAMRTMRKLAGEGFGRFWFDVQLDYRGRAYSRCPRYCPQERDIWRASIQLADGVDPGEDGMRAIRIYAAGLYGHDKLSMNDRDQWTMDHMRQIAACAVDPESHIDFWSAADKGDNAWQFLQACFALTDPRAAANYPVGIDGTANGLQHYCAMSLDEDAAPLVNMIESSESDAPRSPYAVIAKRVGQDVAADSLTNPIAAMLSGKIDTAIVKQPVMTTVYGVTPAGMRAQLTDSLAFIEDKKLRWRAAKYLQERIMAALRGQFPRAMALMAWFRDAADAFSDRGLLMEWTSPIGFPVQSRHVATKSTTVHMATGRYNIRIADPNAGVRVKKQRDSSAPGIVHSIDAADMFRKGIRARREGLSFWPNHDCYRTHAAHWRAMNRLVRETFVELHTDSIPLRLYHEWRAMGLDIQPPPERGSLDLRRLLGSSYFVK